jgi:serine/threonine protein kinase
MAENMPPKKKQYNPLPKGTQIGEYTIIDIVGTGGFGAIYCATAPHLEYPVALKIEIKSEKSSVLQREVQIHTSINENPYFPILYEVIETKDMSFISMELLGPNLSSLKNKIPGNKFLMPCLVRIAIESLRTIQSIHSFGILHRDIKPGNLLVRNSKSHPIILIDFGLSRPYKTENKMIPPRNRPGFVGTATYASLNAHLGKELGRRDDLISWFFSMMRLMKKELP